MKSTGTTLADEFGLFADDEELYRGAFREFFAREMAPATEPILARSGLSMDELDAYEVNEAFARVPLAWFQELGRNMARLNPRGGAIALGHALGSTGTRLLGSLIAHLENTGWLDGLENVCKGQGMANAVIIERIGS